MPLCFPVPRIIIVESKSIGHSAGGWVFKRWNVRVKSDFVAADGVVLLEAISNLLANAMFEKGSDLDSIFHDICNLADRCGILATVTIANLKDDGYDEETAAYINGLNEINQKLCLIKRPLLYPCMIKTLLELSK